MGVGEVTCLEQKEEARGSTRKRNCCSAASSSRQLGSISTKVGEGPGETHALLGSAPDTEVTSGPLTPDYGAASPGEQELGSRLQAEDVGRGRCCSCFCFLSAFLAGSPEVGLRLLPMVQAGGREVREGPEPWSGVLRCGDTGVSPQYLLLHAPGHLRASQTKGPGGDR